MLKTDAFLREIYVSFVYIIKAINKCMKEMEGK